MKITIACVGKIKEKFYKDAVSEYEKRLGRYCKLEILEVADEKTPEDASGLQKEQIKEKEARRLMEKIREDAYVCLLEIRGKKLSSEGFAGWMEGCGITGESHIVFVIGGSLGLHELLHRRADMELSFSDMTFPHQLMRVILLEQVYRAFRIINHQPYHK